MIISSLVLGVAGIALAVVCIRRAFRALGIDVLEMLVFFGLAERVTTPHPLVAVGPRGQEIRLPRARYVGFESRRSRAA